MWRSPMSRKAPLTSLSKIACLSVAAAAALIAGCTMGWVRPNTSAEQSHEDYAECEISAAGRYPPYIRGGSHDANQDLRDEETKYCMRQRGYTYTRVR